MSQADLKHWSRSFFRKQVFFPGDSRHNEAAPNEASFLMKAMGLRKGERLLDLCCGTGRHSIPFARQGLTVLGLDSTSAYLAEARRRARGLEGVRFLKGDMRRIPFRAEFDAAVNLWTSFGYFMRPSDDLKVLRGLARALKPGGRFLIDIINADWLRRHAFRKNWGRRDDGAYVLEDFQMREGPDPAGLNTWTVLRPGRRTLSATFFVRNYNYVRMARLLRRAGLEPKRRWGGLDGSPFRGAKSRRLVVLAQKRP